MLALVVLSHRHNKEESITKKKDKHDLDFSVVRDTMYKYSKKAQERFFRNSFLAFFFIAFSASPEGIGFINEKFADKGHEYLVRMHAEMAELKEDAIHTLRTAKHDAAAKVLASKVESAISM